MIDFLTSWLASVPAFAAPYALAALGLIIIERSGVLSLGAEGFMLMGALGAAGFCVATGHSAWEGMIVGALSASALSLVFAVMTVSLRINQVIASLVLVFFAQGLTSLIATTQGWTNVPITGLERLKVDGLSNIPIVGPIFFQHDAIVYLVLPIFLGMSWMISRSLFGLRLRAVGDGPEAADAAGVSVAIYRYSAIVVGSALVGLAGAYLTVGVVKVWVDGVAGGRGWIAVALVIFAHWRPWRALVGALLFGGIEALIPRIAAIGIPAPKYLMLMTPYIATLAVMVWVSLRARDKSVVLAPRALGEAYTREERR